MRPILHVGAWGRNWGDQAIALGARHAAGPGHEWLPLDCQVERFTVERVRELEADAGPDGVWLIGGGGLIWAKPELDSPSGWQWQIEQDALEAIRLPIVVWAVGSPTFPHGDRTWDLDAPWAKAIRDSLSLLRAKVSMFAVRDDWTNCLLFTNGLASCEVVPDVAWALAGKLKRTKQAPRVGLVWAEDKADWRWDGKEGEVRLAIERELKGEQVRVIPHLSDEHCEGWPALWQRSCAWVNQPDYQHVPVWAANVYSGLDVVISARKHGIVLAAAQGIPAVGIGNVVEVQQMCDEIRAPCVATEELLNFDGVLVEAIESARTAGLVQYASAIRAGDKTRVGLRTALDNARGTGG